MYIKSVEIQNIRSIENFQMNFSSPPGWHVILGDNGAGKSTLIKAIAFGLIGPDVTQLREDWKSWQRREKERGKILLSILSDPQIDFTEEANNKHKELQYSTIVKLEASRIYFDLKRSTEFENIIPQSKIFNFWENQNKKGWFSAAYGPFRRFTGGNQEYEKIHDSSPTLTAHLSAFGEGYALDQSLKWLQKLKFEELENKHNFLYFIKFFLNKSKLLPHNLELNEVNSEGIFFIDGNGIRISVEQLSDGFRSILSLFFDLIRQLTRVYGMNTLSREFKNEAYQIKLPGVVLIDEVDAHLHPTWQVRIGEWFTQFFPQIQFIVTTHSPLICRAAKKGSVWRLAIPGTLQDSGEIKGTELQRLIYGNVLDAYGTEVFGANVTRSNQAHEMLDELARLNKRSIKGIITDSEIERLAELRNILPTESL